MFLDRLFSKKPNNRRIYAIGDIHGRLDCLKEIQARIQHHLNKYPVSDSVLVYLGDYIDRGPDSKGVIDRLLQKKITNKTVFLKGNHEYALELFLNDDLSYSTWCRWGAEATLSSYGIVPCLPDASEEEVEQMRQQLKGRVANHKRKFYSKLKMWHEEGDFLFVHAGLRPGVALKDQYPEDLMFIREEFLTQPVTIEKTIVHGHTIFEKPLVRDKSIGIDTGAYKTGKLTAIVLDQKGCRFLVSSKMAACA